MGVTLGHVHGRAGVTHVYTHIRAALDAQSTLPAWLSYTLPHPPDLVLDQLDTTSTCDACFVELTSEP